MGCIPYIYIRTCRSKLEVTASFLGADPVFVIRSGLRRRNPRARPPEVPPSAAARPSTKPGVLFGDGALFGDGVLFGTLLFGTLLFWTLLFGTLLFGTLLFGEAPGAELLKVDDAVGTAVFAEVAARAAAVDAVAAVAEAEASAASAVGCGGGMSADSSVVGGIPVGRAEIPVGRAERGGGGGGGSSAA